MSKLRKTLFCLPMVFCFHQAYAATDVPGLLKFANEYSGEDVSQPKSVETEKAPAITRGNASLQLRQAQIKQAARDKQNQAKIAQLQQEVSALSAQNAQLKSNSSTSQNEKEINEAREQLVALTKELNELKVSQTGSQRELKAQQDKLFLSESKNKEIEGIVTAQEQQIKTLKEQSALLTRPTTVARGKPEASYAAGLNMGREALDLQAQRKIQGIDTDPKLVLAGIIDAFNASPIIDENRVKAVLKQTEIDLAANTQKIISAQKKQGENYRASMLKTKGYKKSDGGFIYQIDYAGNGDIQDTDIVDISVIEKLTDGTVIHDMQRGGDVVSQALNNYPQLFKDAIKLLKNHGSVKVIAPPELAYGDEGYPPKIPPAATIVYEIRIVDVKSAGK